MKAAMKLETLKITMLRRMDVRGNPTVVGLINGSEFTAYRQAGLGLWAFLQRLSMNSDDQILFDELCNQVWNAGATKLPFRWAK